MKTPPPQVINPSSQIGAQRRSLRRDLLLHLAVAAGLALAVSLALVGTGALNIGHAAKLMVLFALAGGTIWHALFRGDHKRPALQDPHPHARLGPANGVTLTRLALTIFLAALVGEPQVHAPLASVAATAWVLVVVATGTALLDAVDGHLARRSGMSSAFGARFDMETDAFFILVLCALVVQSGQAGAWILASGLMRYAFVSAAILWPWLAGPLTPSKRRQTVCVVQVTALIICLGPIVPSPLATALAGFSLALLTASFAIDVRALARHRLNPQET